MSLAYHCDREGCDSWAKYPGLGSRFLELTEGEDVLAHFCCLDCLTHWAAANSEPTEVIQ